MLPLSWPGSQIKENNHENRKSHLISSQILQLTSRKVPKKQSPMLLVASSSFPKTMFRELRRQKPSHPLFLKETLSSLQHYKSVKYRRQLKLPPTSYRKTQKRKIPQTLPLALQTADPIFSAVGKITVPWKQHVWECVVAPELSFFTCRW